MESQPLCNAPFTNMFFDQLGRVQSCCWNSQYPIGNISVNTIDDIWHGPSLLQLRSAILASSLSLGCGPCAVQLQNGWSTANFVTFRRDKVSGEAPEWPQRIELSISNTCNLECIMCSGMYSSAIRAHRECAPPLKYTYPDDFPDQLLKYIPHLKTLKFLGGEPFLVEQYFRIWDLMIHGGSTTLCHVTTNATVLNRRVQGVLEKLRFAIAVSLDGQTKETVERIRVNADFDHQMRIVQFLRQYTRSVGTDFALTFCFMKQNWHEFGEYCLWADEMDCHVAVNTVTWPPEYAIYSHGTEVIKPILDGMELQAPRLDALLTRNRSVWFAELDRLRGRYARLTAG